MIPATRKYLKRAQFLLLAALACDPALTRLFTPLHPQLGEYEVCTDARPIEAVVGTQEGLHYRDIESVEPLEAFGMVGTYDRAAVVRLYGGRRVRVVRGWKTDGDRFESLTLVSPYPDASLSRLEPGTMVIRWQMLRGSAPASVTFRRAQS